MTATDLGIELFESFSALMIELNRVATCVREDHHLPLWVALTDHESTGGIAMREKAIDLYQSLWYSDGQDGRETITCPGIVGASTATVHAVAELNRQKDRFKLAVLALKELSKRESAALLAELPKRDQTVMDAMRRLGAVRLNLKQAYRNIPQLAQRPKKIGFTWSKQGRTIERTTVAEARKMLERRRDSEDKTLALRRLNAIPRREILARVRPTVPHLRANLLFDRPLDGVARRLIQSPLPIIIPLEPGESLPRFVPIPTAPCGQNRVKRSDVKIEDQPYLPLLRIHRYQPAFRT